MRAGRKLLWFWLGFMAAAALTLPLQTQSALAQGRIDTSIASPAAPAVDPRREPIIRSLRPQLDLDRDPPRAARPQPQVDAEADIDTDDDPGRIIDGAPPRQVRRVPRDGDLRPLIVPPLLDGTIEVVEPAGPLDGGDPTIEEHRSPEDIAAFESPPAGFDPDAFRIELSPLLNRRTAQLFRFGPYQPIGTRLGGFVLFSQIETGVSATNNVFQSSDTKRFDMAIDIAPTLRLVSNWGIHAVELSATGLATFQREFSTENDRDYTLEMRGRVDITRRSSIEALASRDVTQESRGSINATSSAGQDRTDIITDTAAVTVSHRFNRLRLQLRGSAIRTDYSPSQIDLATPPAAPVIVSVDDRDFLARNVALRASWEFNPALTLFGEAALNERRYDELQGGIKRDSAGTRFAAGVSFGDSGEILRGEASIVYAHQSPDAAELGDIRGVGVDANLAWRINALTSLLFTAGTDITETTIAGSGGGFSRSVGLAMRHAFARNFIATAGVDYFTTDYESSPISESTLTASLGAEYSLNRHIVLFGDYEHVIFDTTEPASSYDSDEVRLGVRVRR